MFRIFHDTFDLPWDVNRFVTKCIPLVDLELEEILSDALSCLYEDWAQLHIIFQRLSPLLQSQESFIVTAVSKFITNLHIAVCRCELFRNYCSKYTFFTVRQFYKVAQFILCINIIIKFYFTFQRSQRIVIIYEYW